ncbi:unnamed protein product (macronuclear) [Paramecium tetraurelia]|uniref:FAD synthase n=1 Tax=Paramecium tetraurelia TaxID=5888 RepID=A0DD33_PARTE|nr:uncharacterized protein GSPATT00015809001 [Paramecium tetraurelia]CAK80950.1 unnamed protein product [Paramecium tetraurelia]|eukprot:XP_001448347.1 hypothetical protein (macronuclear) [Paramecium tetraurelia strain d4-2]
MDNQNSQPSTILFQEAIDFLVKIFQIFKFPQIKICFNGGKDATVVLYLAKMALEKLQISREIECIYFKEKQPFPEIIEFMEQQKKALNLQIVECKGCVKENLQNQVQLQAVIMGTRRSDPHGKTLNLISITDNNYPSLLRINPILEWNYSQIWEFIRTFNIPYCSLYDQGYMCLGEVGKTQPDKNYKIGMKPWEFDPQFERQNRE